MRAIVTLLMALMAAGCGDGTEPMRVSTDERAAMETAKRWEHAWATGRSEVVCALMSARATLEVAEAGGGCAAA